MAVVGTDRPDSPAPTASTGGWALLRWLMLTAVIAGIFGMHVLTGSEMTTGHGLLPGPAPMAGHTAMVQTSAMPDPTEQGPLPVAGFTQGALSAGVVKTSAAATSVAATSAGSGQGTGHDSMGACILFLVVGGAAALLALLATRLATRFGHDAAAVASIVAGVMRRGPPGRGWPRIALCVNRV